MVTEDDGNPAAPANFPEHEFRAVHINRLGRRTLKGRVHRFLSIIRDNDRDGLIHRIGRRQGIVYYVGNDLSYAAGSGYDWALAVAAALQREPGLARSG